MKLPIPLRVVVLFLLLGTFLFADPASKSVIIDLESLTKMVLQENLGIRIAETEREIPLAAVTVQKGIFDTLLNASTDYDFDKKESSNTVFGRKKTRYGYIFGLDKKLPIGLGVSLDFKNDLFTSDSTFSQRRFWETSVTLGLAQELARNYFGFMDRLEIETREYQARATDMKSYRTIEEIVGSSHQAYWNLAFAVENLSIREGNLKLARQLHKINKERLELGLIEKSDFHASAAHVKRGEAERELAKMQLEEARIALRQLLNQASETTTYTTESSLSFIKKNFSQEEALKTAYEVRQDLADLKKEIEAQHLIVRVAQNNRMPQIDVKGSIAANGLDRNYGQALEETGHFISPKYTIGIFITFPIENRLARGEAQTERAKKQNLLYQLAQLEQKIQSEVKQTAANLSALEAATERRMTAEQLLSKKLNEEVDQLKKGRSSIDIVIQDHERLLAAKTETASSIRDYNLAWTKFHLAQGTLLKSYESYMKRASL